MIPTITNLARTYYDRKSNKNVVLVELLTGGYEAICRNCLTVKSVGMLLETAIDLEVEKFCLEHRHETCHWTWDLVKKVYL